MTTPTDDDLPATPQGAPAATPSADRQGDADAPRTLAEATGDRAVGLEGEEDAELIGEEVSELERHLPVELDELCARLALQLQPEWRAPFEAVAEAVQARMHAALALELADLRRGYRPFDPTRDTLPVAGEEATPEARTRFLSELGELLRRANYVELGRTELERALEAISPEGLDVAVDLDAFAELRVYARGRFSRRFQVRRLLEKREVVVQGYHRFLLAVALRDRPERLHLRLYRDVMDTDLEMFLPNTKVRIGRNDRIKLGVLGGGGAVGGIAATITKLGATTSPQGWAFALAGLGGVLWRQTSQVFHHRTKYMARLSKALYYHGLDNDFGALVHVAQMAAQQECREVLLGYGVAVSAEAPLASIRALDDRAEQFLEREYDLHANFDVADAVRKLEKLDLLGRDAGGALRVASPPEALARLGGG